MANPNSPLNGQGLAIDLVLNGASVPGLKRGYGSEALTGGATDVGHHQGVAMIPASAGAVATVAAAVATAVMAAVAAKKNYLAGFSISGGGATAGSLIKATITGLAIGTMGIDIAVPAGVTLAIAPIFVALPIPIPASAVNTPITLTVPSLGAGNTDCTIAIWGYASA